MSPLAACWRLDADDVLDALRQVSPAASIYPAAVELSPGDKDLDKVAELFEKLGLKKFQRAEKAKVKSKNKGKGEKILSFAF